MDCPTFKAGVFEIAAPAEVTGMKSPTHPFGKGLKGTLVGPPCMKIIV